FFQAEDGIRDLIVTGVQTCALPIFPAGARLVAVPSRRQLLGVDRRAEDARPDLLELLVSPCDDLRALHSKKCIQILILREERSRSEERRVGKECRSRWAE